MKTILVLGAGLSASSLIRYFLQNSTKNDWEIRICDRDIDIVKSKINGLPNGVALSFNALDPEERRSEIEKADIVISMLPARFHLDIAKDCIQLKTNLITPSYISPEMKELDAAAKEAGIVIMNEIGVDPGLDHMSAMKVIDEIQKKGGKLIGFESFTGGLIAPESDNNPWNYKLTWNPRNVVLAGQGGAAKFIQEGKYKYIPYNRLFRRTEIIEIDGYGKFEGYANRNSLSYRETYGLEGIPTIYRGTLRRKGFSKAWNVFVQMGATDDSFTLEDSKNMTKREFINSFLPYHPTDSVELKLRYKMKIDQDDAIWDKLVWLGIFEETGFNLDGDVTPAQYLQKIIEEKWVLDPDDKDMLVMWHKFNYLLNGKEYEVTSHMINIGEDQVYTSMSNTVGLPAAICAKMILNDVIKIKGVTLPTNENIYLPILKELAEYGVRFIEKESIHDHKEALL
tara:strand:+ start:33056 stop:34417 length:1362 start_codon:yes stop_codon:yes gene_type:complete